MLPKATRVKKVFLDHVDQKEDPVEEEIPTALSLKENKESLGFLELGDIKDALAGMDQQDFRVQMETEVIQVQLDKRVQRVSPVIRVIPDRCFMRTEPVREVIKVTKAILDYLVFQGTLAPWAGLGLQVHQV